MIAIFKTDGKQYLVKTGQILKVGRIKGKKGDNYSFNYILAISEGSKNIIGSPIIKGASIKAKILDQIKSKKIIVFKKRRRKNYRLTQGHRQYLTVLKIESILKGGQKTSISAISKKPTISKTKKVKKDRLLTKPTSKITATKKTVKKKQKVKKTVAKKSTKSKK